MSKVKFKGIRKVFLEDLKYILIFIFPFTIWFGQYFKLYKFNLANYFIIIILIFSLDFFLKKENKSIIAYISFFVLIPVYSIALTANTHNSYTMTIILSLSTGVVTMIFIANFSEKELAYFLHSMQIFTFMLLIWSLVEIFFGKYLFLTNPDFTLQLNFLGLHYPAVCFVNPNDLAQFLIMSTGIVLFTQFRNKKRPFLTFILTVCVVINTSSRLAFLSIGISSILYIIFQLRVNKSLRKNMVFICPLMMILLWITVCVNEKEVSDFLNRFIVINSSELYVTARSSIYDALLQLGEEHIFTGAGVGESYVVSKMGPHNFFLFLFSDFGIFFSLGLITILILFFLNMLKNLNLCICGIYLNQIMLSLLMVFPLLSSISSANEQRKTLWVFLGICLAVIKNNNIKNKNNMEEAHENTILL